MTWGLLLVKLLRYDIGKNNELHTVLARIVKQVPRIESKQMKNRGASEQEKNWRAAEDKKKRDSIKKYYDILEDQLYMSGGKKKTGRKKKPSTFAKTKNSRK